MAARLYRLYKLKPKLARICLFEINDGAVRVVRLLQSDPLGTILEGEDQVKNLRAAVESGDYLVSRHDPEDSFFREAEIVKLDDVFGSLRGSRT